MCASNKGLAAVYCKLVRSAAVPRSPEEEEEEVGLRSCREQRHVAEQEDVIISNRGRGRKRSIVFEMQPSH